MYCMLRNSAKLQGNVRLFHTSIMLTDISRAMNKVLNRARMKSKKNRYYETPVPSAPTAFSKGVYEGSRSKRADVLNKLFMHYITDLMAAGESSTYFVGHGIEVSHVQVSPDFSIVNIYWIAKGTEKDDIIDEILKTHVGALRHELAQLKVVGVIPKFNFVKDKRYALIAEVDRLLAIADFGDDHIPVDLARRLTARLELNTTLDQQVVNRIQIMDNSDENAENIKEEPIPPMPHNIFNLNHSDIMNRILNSKKKVPQSSAIESESNNVARTINENVTTFASEQEERQAFRDFLQKRQILKDKAGKLDKNYEPGAEYFHGEFLKQHQQDHDFADIVEESDYLDDEFDQK